MNVCAIRRIRRSCTNSHAGRCRIARNRRRSRATALLEAVAGNQHTPLEDRVFLAETMPFPNVLVKLSEDPSPRFGVRSPRTATTRTGWWGA